MWLRVIPGEYDLGAEECGEFCSRGPVRLLQTEHVLLHSPQVFQHIVGIAKHVVGGHCEFRIRFYHRSFEAGFPVGDLRDYLLAGREPPFLAVPRQHFDLSEGRAVLRAMPVAASTESDCRA